MEIKSAYSPRGRYITEPGEEIQNEYSYTINNKGQKVLKKSGEFNIYEKIQSNHEMVKIENVLKRTAVGDMSDFRPDGIYQDTTQIPTNLIEAKQQMMKLENYWRTLPSEIKKKYNNSVDEYMSKVGTKEWLTDNGYLKPEKAENVGIKPVETTVEVPKEEVKK